MAASKKTKRWEVMPEKIPQHGPEARKWLHANTIIWPNGNYERVGYKCGYVAHEVSRPSGMQTGRRKEW